MANSRSLMCWMNSASTVTNRSTTLSARHFNIDHVLVGPGGVFAIETKFRSGRGEITFRNGEGLFVGGRIEEKDCLKQARGTPELSARLSRNTVIDVSGLHHLSFSWATGG